MATGCKEEFDLDRHKKCRFEVLLSNDWLVKLPFKGFPILGDPKSLGVGITVVTRRWRSKSLRGRRSRNAPR